MALCVGVLSEIGCSEVTVYRQPSVAVFSTGDDLVPIAEKLGPGETFDANGPTITCMVAETGARA